MRTVSEIKKSITDTFIADSTVIAKYNLEAGKTFEEQFSTVSIESILFYCVAFCVWLHESLFDQFRTDVSAELIEKRAPTREWYANKAKDFQLGYSLVPETDVYDNSAVDSGTVEASKVVKYAAVIRQINTFGRVLLRIKCAGFDGTDLVQHTNTTVSALREYFDIVGAAGDNISVESNAPDKLYNEWVVDYDPLILSPQGDRLDGTDTDVIRKAIKSFLVEGMPVIGGTYVRTYHVDWLQKVPGVVVPRLVVAKASYGSQPLAEIVSEYDPDAGWLRFINAETDLIITMVPRYAIR